MAINIDTSQPLRRPLELQQLVEAVVAAGSADEASWLECKSDLDLTQGPGRFKVARAVLSFANRMPDLAEKTCGGLAYVIVGAEPGNVAGTQEIDAADLENGLRPYLGTDGPVWSPTYVTVNGKKVLVIVVEAPKWGDRMHTLRKQGEASKGTVFVRAQSNSRPADDAEIRLLEDRFVRGHQAPEINGLEVGYQFVGRDDHPATPLLVLEPTPVQIDEWIERRRTAIRAQHQAVIDKMEPPQTKNPAISFFKRPSIDNDAIEHHLEACRQALFDASRRAMIKAGYGLLQLTAHNPGRRTLEHVQLTLTLQTPHSAFDEGHVPEDLESLPAPPELPRPRNNPFDFLGNKTDYSALAIPRMSSFVNPNIYIPRGIDIEDGSITLDLGQIRPEKTVSSTEFHLFLHEMPDDDKVTVAWTLTSTSTEGIQRGALDIPTYPMRGVLLLPTAGLPKETGRA